MVKYLDITASDIREGIKGSYNYCPIALSVQRKFQVKPGFASVAVDVMVWRDIPEPSQPTFEQERWKLSANGHKFIHDFDSEHGVSPCKIRITREV